MRPQTKAVILSGGKVDPQTTGLTLTCTTVGAATLTLQGMTVAAGKTVVVTWGDGGVDTYAAGAGTRTHAYAGAGVWTVKMTPRKNITLLDLRDTKLSGAITTDNPLPSGLTSLAIVGLSSLTYNANTNPLPAGLTSIELNNLPGLTYNANTNPLPAGLTSITLNTLGGLTYNANTNPLPAGLTLLNLVTINITYNANTNPLPAGLETLYLSTLSNLTYNANTNPLPAGLTYLYLRNVSNLTYNANTNPLPAGLTYLFLHTLTGLTWAIDGAAPWPTGATAATVLACPSVTVSAWTDNAIRTMQFENAYSQAAVDALIAAIYANRAAFTWATPTLDIAGGANAAPSGAYADEDPPTTGKGMIYELVNDPETEGFNKWAITYTA